MGNRNYYNGLPISILLQILLTSLIFGKTAAYETAELFHAMEIANIERPRSLFLDPAGDILVTSDTLSTIFGLRETGEEYTTTIIVDGDGLQIQFGLAYHDGYIYSSSETVVYRWAYVPGSFEMVTTSPEIVIDGIDPGGHHVRPLIFDASGRLYVAIGSGANVDDDSSRARIRRFQLDPANFPLNFSTGEVFADGTRNTVGLAFDAHGHLWGVDNGVDELSRPDLNITYNGNPAEELNRFLEDNLGAHHGYPWCFSTDEHQVFPKGTQFALDLVPADGIHTDAWCKNIQNNLPPILAMPAHQAPLGIEFYGGQGCGEVEGAFPCELIGDAFVAFRGSWNSDIPSGYRVARLPFTKSGDHLPTGEMINIFYEPDTLVCPANCIRPVDAIFNSKGHLIVSDEDNGRIFSVTYAPNKN